MKIIKKTFFLFPKIIKQLFRLKYKNVHPAPYTYEEVSSCGENYIEDTKKNLMTLYDFRLRNTISLHKLT